MNSIANVRLRGTASDFSGLVQRARTTAEQGNTTHTLRFGLPSGNGAYVDLNGNGQYDSGEPMIQFGGNANQVAAPAGATGKPTNLDASGGPLSVDRHLLGKHVVQFTRLPLFGQSVRDQRELSLLL